MRQVLWSESRLQPNNGSARNRLASKETLRSPLLGCDLCHLAIRCKGLPQIVVRDMVLQPMQLEAYRSVAMVDDDTVPLHDDEVARRQSRPFTLGSFEGHGPDVSHLVPRQSGSIGELREVIRGVAEFFY